MKEKKEKTATSIFTITQQGMAVRNLMTHSSRQALDSGVFLELILLLISMLARDN